MLTVIAFVVALGVLIAVHEWGHYRVAVACGVKVLRFSIGFGRGVLRWKPRRQRAGQDTEFSIGLIPLGGYVKMLDEREGPVDPAERHRAFNTQPLSSRALIVAAGPVANLLLAVLLYAVVNWWGVMEARPVLGSPVAGSLAAQAGLQGGEVARAAAFEGEAPHALRSFEDLRWMLTRGALDGRDVLLTLEDGRRTRELRMPLSTLPSREADAQLFRRIGLNSPWTPPVIGEVMKGGAAERAGLRKGDVVVSAGGAAMGDGQQLREWIRASAQAGTPAASTWQVRRDGQLLTLQVQPDLANDGGHRIGRIAAFVGAAPEMTLVRYGPVDGLVKGAAKTWEVSTLTLRMMGRMVMGEASLKNLSGPLTIADYAGKSASLGMVQYLMFIALISVSLGVLNLLPLPVLDGGHLMYYLWEAVTGRGVSDAWMERLQRGGVAVLLVMMSIALFNDVTRLFG
ncbi:MULTISPECIES: RIP metalloprotease RseP [Ramlibacter]|uniref:Zinc metalloprotease n=1 Tax=Ramlibacter aquaticus TaxID=2780094 RepID=A0ABR9SFY7_9BURK|nr:MULTISPECIES: RIP metalloprotease RseP [Ramlibacter]MBE7941261.1 RIP metalloprotease RseP [Ramlibacter aquaticus]